jgi:hypothetical protein
LGEAAQAGWPGLPVLIVSGYAELPQGTAAAYPRLAKPFRQDQLARMVQETTRASRGAAQVIPLRRNTRD